MREENVTPKLSPMVKSISRCFSSWARRPLKRTQRCWRCSYPFRYRSIALRLLLDSRSWCRPPPLRCRSSRHRRSSRRRRRRCSSKGVRRVHLSLRGGAATLVGSIIATAESVPALVILAISIGLEVVATTCMKLAATSSPKWFIGVYGGYVLCFSIFPLALKRLPLSIAYATWSGVGTLASVIIGATAFGETITKAKLLWIAFIILGVVGLNC